MIPKVIHYCWFGGKPLPANIKKCMKSWKKYCPDYKIVEWNEENFNISDHPFVKAAYDAKAWAFVSDFVRLQVIYKYGGIYLDTDVKLLKNLDFLLKNNYFVGVQQSHFQINTGLGFGAEKGCSVIKRMLAEYDEITFNHEKRKEIMCPILNTNTFMVMGYTFEDKLVKLEGGLILPPKYMDPIAPGKAKKNLMCEQSISIHLYLGSWTSWRQRIKRKIFLFIGQQRVNEIKHFLGRK